MCVFVLPAYLWSWALTVSFVESPDSAITGSARSGWTGSVRALKIKFTRAVTISFSLMCHEMVTKSSLADLLPCQRLDLIHSFCEIRFVRSVGKVCTYPLHTCPFPLTPAAMPPPYSVRYCRMQAGCWCCCYWGLLAAMASCSVWSAVVTQ